MANNISVIGRLVADSEQKHTSGGTVLEFRLADDVGFGEKKVTNWWRCAWWGKAAEGKMVDFLKKGQQVVVFGEATMREWDDNDGAKRLSPEIRVNAVQLAGSKDGAHGGGNSQSQPAKQRKDPTPQDFDDDSIPF